MDLYQSLLKYREEGYYPMHMPGHKRNTDLLQMVNPYSIDITEIDGFDNLHRPEGVIKNGMERWARIYGSLDTYYLVGGSSAGILAGISAATNRGDKILVARNSHKSVYHGIYLNGLKPVYLYPERIKSFGINGSISPKTVEEVLEREKDIRLVVVTSPTYEGVVSDIEGIAKVAHRYNIPLMVDEAHGAHLGFHPGFPKSSVACGADIVVQSIHKTLPAFTQSALLHANSSLIAKDKLLRYLSIYQSTSPSYILMAGMDKCRELLESRGKELFAVYYDMLTEFFKAAEEFKNIRLLTDNIVRAEGGYAFDPSKLNLSVRGTEYTGTKLYHILLTEYKIQMEMAAGDYCLGMTSIGDRKEGFDRLSQALLEVDKRLSLDSRQKEKAAASKFIDYSISPAKVITTCEEAQNAETKTISLEESKGLIAAEYVYLYPPGIPLLVPGEEITEDILHLIAVYKEQELTIQGLSDFNACKIKVVV